MEPGPLVQAIAWIAVAWCVVLMVLFSWPTSGNISWPFMLGTIVLLVIYYFAWARSASPARGSRVLKPN